MRPPKVTDSDIIAGLTRVFKTKGYEGASLNELAEATGLKKASLYHRFPKGKEEMASAVLVAAVQWIEEGLFRALADNSNSPEVRLKNGLETIRSVYGEGKETCILRALSMKTGLELFQEQVDQGLQLWIDAFKQLGLAFGLTQEEALSAATETLIEIQGSLIVTQGLDDLTIFEKTLRKIERRYLGV